MSGIKNHPVLLALPTPRCVVGSRIEQGVAYPEVRLLYGLPRVGLAVAPPPIDELTFRGWWRYLGSEAALWWLLIGKHRLDPSVGFISINASERHGEVHRRYPAVAATIRCPVDV